MSRPRTCRNASRVPTNNSGTFKPISAIFCVLIFSLAQALASILVAALASVPGLSGRYTNKDLQKTTKLALELFVKDQKHG